MLGGIGPDLCGAEVLASRVSLKCSTFPSYLGSQCSVGKGMCRGWCWELGDGMVVGREGGVTLSPIRCKCCSENRPGVKFCL